MKLFVTRSAWKEASKSKLTKDALVKSSDRTNRGLIDAEIGAHLFKQHVGRKGGFRLILYLEKNKRSVVLHVFPKNEQPNITGHELKTLRDFAGVLADLSDEAFVQLAHKRGWKEITDEALEEDVPKRPPSIDP